ncbi:MAG: hypothetical protein ACREKS_05875 [Candidatus Rokuibacteriota bacterium]
MMGLGVWQVAAPILGWGLPIGLTFVLVMLLNRRDRRRAKLLELVSGQFDPAVLRSDVAIRIEAGLLSEWALVVVDMPDHSQAEARDAFGRLSQVLPPQVGLLVRGGPEQFGRGRRPLAAASRIRRRPSLATVR